MAEDVLACRALEGVEEKVFYHGEEVATRRRFDSRLLLAHLARLDRLTADPAASAFADDFEEALARFERGEPQPDPAPADGSGGEGRKMSPGQCNTRSMSPRDGGAPDASDLADGGADELADDEDDQDEDDASADAYADCGWEDDPRYDRWPEGSRKHRLPPPGYPEWDEDMEPAEHWVNGAYVPPVSRLLNAMEADYPNYAEHSTAMGRDRWTVEALQMEAFADGVERWWEVTSPRSSSPKGGSADKTRSSSPKGGSAENHP